MAADSQTRQDIIDVVDEIGASAIERRRLPIVRSKALPTVIKPAQTIRRSGV